MSSPSVCFRDGKNQIPTDNDKFCRCEANPRNQTSNDVGIYIRPQLRSGQIIVIPGTKPSSYHELILDSVYDYNNILEDKVIVLCCSDQPDPSEWILADCRNEYGTPVLTHG